MSKPETIADVLDAAADLIEPEGAWMQGRFGSRESGCYCIMGALHQHRWDTAPVLSGQHFHALVEAPADFLQALLGGLPPAVWNDAPERTQAEVVAKLREAAALAREQGK